MSRATETTARCRGWRSRSSCRPLRAEVRASVIERERNVRVAEHQAARAGPVQAVDAVHQVQAGALLGLESVPLGDLGRGEGGHAKGALVHGQPPLAWRSMLTAASIRALADAR